MGKKLELNSIHNMDGIEFLENIYKEYGEESIDMFLCDLPYTFKGKKRVTANAWDTPIDTKRFFELVSKLLTKTGTVVLTATNPFAAHLISTIMEMNINPIYKDKNIELVSFKYDWIWEKDNGSNFVHVKHQPFKVHEQVLVFGKAATTYNKNNVYMEYNPQFTYGKPYKIRRDMQKKADNLSGFKGRTNTDNKEGKRYPRSIIKFNTERGLHPTQKPTSLFSYLIVTHCPPRGRVVDICAGSGTTAISALSTNRYFIVNDKDSGYFGNIKDRVLDYQLNKLITSLMEEYKETRFKVVKGENLIELLHNDDTKKDNSEFDNELFEFSSRFLNEEYLSKLAISYDFTKRI